MNLNEQEIKSLIDDYSSQYEEDTQFLLDHGWTKKSDDPNCKLYVSPKGEEHGHHWIDG